MTRKIFGTLLILAASLLQAGTVTGPVQSPSGGGLPNAVFTFQLTQPAVVSGTATIVTTPVNCYTDSLGNVVGLPGNSGASVPAPSLSSNIGVGTLPGGTYFVK